MTAVLFRGRLSHVFKLFLLSDTPRGVNCWSFFCQLSVKIWSKKEAVYNHWTGLTGLDSLDWTGGLEWWTRSNFPLTSVTDKGSVGGRGHWRQEARNIIMSYKNSGCDGRKWFSTKLYSLGPLGFLNRARSFLASFPGLLSPNAVIEGLGTRL